MAKNFDQAYKLEICKRVVENKESVAVGAREVGIHANTIYGWVQRFPPVDRVVNEMGEEGKLDIFA